MAENRVIGRDGDLPWYLFSEHERLLNAQVLPRLVQAFAGAVQGAAS